MKKLNIALEKFSKYTATVLFIVVFIITFIQVLFRNLFGGGLAWIEEVSTMLMSAFAFFAVSYSVRKRNYTFLDFFFQRMNKPVQKTLSLVSYILIVFFLGYMVYSSIGFTSRQWYIVSSYLLLPRALWYVSFPVNCLIMLSFFIEEIMVVWSPESGAFTKGGGEA